MALSREDVAAIQGLADKLKVDPGTLGGLFELESNMNPNIWGGAGGKYRGLIQFGPEARKEVGLPSGSMTVAQQIPYVEKYFQQRGFQPGKHGARELYRTVLVGNPHQSGTDSWGTNSDKAAQRMLPGGDLYERARKKLGSTVGSTPAPGSGSSGQSTGSPAPQEDALLGGFQGFLKSMLGGGGSSGATAVENPFMGAIKRGNPFLAAIPGLGFSAAMAGTGIAERPTRMAGGMDFFQSTLRSLGIGDVSNPGAAAGVALAAPKSAGQGFMEMMLGALGVGQAASVGSKRKAGDAMNNIRPTGGPIKVGRIAKPEEDVFPTTGPHLDVRVQDAKGNYINPGTARSLLQNLVVGGKPLYQQTAQGWEPSFPVTSGFGPRAAPTAGASTFHRGKDFGVSANTPMEWRGGGSYSFADGVGVIELQDGRRIKLLHTRPS